MFIWFGDLDGLAQARHIRPAPAVFVLFATALLVLISSWKWKVILGRLHLGRTCPILDCFRVVLLGVSLGQIVPQDVGSAGARITYLRGVRGFPFDQATYSVFLDRWLDVVVLVVVLPFSALFAAGLISVQWGLTLVFMIVLALVITGALWPAAVTIAFARGFTLVASLLRRFLRTEENRPWVASARHEPLSGAQMPVLLAMAFARIFIVGARAWFTILAVGIDISFSDALMLVPVAQVGLMVPLTPGGLATYDAGWYALLTIQGVSAADAVLFVVMHRVLVMLSLIAMVGLVEAPLQLRNLVLRRWGTAARRLERP